MAPMNARLLRPTASGRFDPRSIGTMVAWYDFSDTSSLTLVNDLVSEIRNKSGAAANLSQGIEANRPSLSTLGGRQAGLFDGSNDHLTSGTAAPQGFGTMFLAHGAGTGNRAAATFARSSPVLEVLSIGVSSGNPGAFGRWTGAGGVNAGISATPSASSVYVTYSTFIRTSNATIFSNGATSGGTSPPSTNTASQLLGGSNLNSTIGSFWNSTIGEILYYDAVLSSSQLLAVERYLKAKWGATY
jgi:hypothetical protein